MADPNFYFPLQRYLETVLSLQIVNFKAVISLKKVWALTWGRRKQF